jgi:hypothetical protein
MRYSFDSLFMSICLVFQLFTRLLMSFDVEGRFLYPANPAKPSERVSLGKDRLLIAGHFRYPAVNDLSIRLAGLFWGVSRWVKSDGGFWFTRRNGLAGFL